MAAGKKQNKNSGLTENEKKFCDEYLVDYNGTKAAIRAGYSKKTACSQASRLLRKVNVIQYLNSRKQKFIEKLEITQERTMQEIGRIAFSDIRRLYDDNGCFKKINCMDDDIAAAIAGSEVFEEFSGSGRSRKKIGITTKLKLWDKAKGLEMLAKHFGVFKDETTPFSVTISIKKAGDNADS